jgi:glucose-6-phosphate 1-epimerase
MTALPEPVHLLTASGSGAMFAHGAQVVSWMPARDGEVGEVLFLSRKAEFDTRAPIRGGIPVCFPWFGPGRAPGMSPAHGFARTAQWHLASVDDGPDAAVAIFRLTEADATSEWFPHAFEAELCVSFGGALQVALTVTNTGTAAFSYEDALHAYFAVGDVERIRIEGLDGAEFVDKTLDPDAGPRIQTGDITIIGETDRVYLSSGPIRIVDPVLDRIIVIDKEGSADTVVWNPWVDRARAIADLADDEWREFVCVEAANTLGQAVSLAPGEQHRMCIDVRVIAPSA